MSPWRGGGRLGGGLPYCWPALSRTPPPQVSLNAWFWSTVFHTRDTDLTEVSPSPAAPSQLGPVPQEPRSHGQSRPGPCAL